MLASKGSEHFYCEPRSVVVSMKRCYTGALGSIPGRVETLGSVSVNHSLTTPRYKIGTSLMWDDGMWCLRMTAHLREYAHQGWVRSQVGSWLES